MKYIKKLGPPDVKDPDDKNLKANSNEGAFFPLDVELKQFVSKYKGKQGIDFLGTNKIGIINCIDGGIHPIFDKKDVDVMSHNIALVNKNSYQKARYHQIQIIF